ncbi:hypothetical protein EA187_18030 [Lujinxingia sediminis]|uniref:Right-handed parallel beta-helix repeat-containing protein n=1 Tax=Lujinxingia sediminis TaxID=2480984 RepID=A0ABY0CNK5_9DELT|nr:hypothetical protein [Lujinxingia sediminis]RVU41558.1 hypothetical protein EA187_18030 [Lujinxingia sediminis]
MVRRWKGLVSVSLTCCALAAAVGCVEDKGEEGTPDEPIELSGTIDADRSFSGEVRITSSIDIAARLTFEPCTRVTIASGALIAVVENGAINAVGEEDCPVIFESANANPAAGDWQRIDIYNRADNANVFEHAIIRHGDGENYGMIWVEEGAQISMKNVSLEKSAYSAIQINGDARIDAFDAVSFKDIGGALVEVAAERVAALAPLTLSGTNPRPYVRVPFSEVMSDVRWSNLGVPYVSEGLEAQAGLTLEAGVTMKLAPEAYVRLRDGGQLVTEGTAEAPVVIESSKSSPAAGDWATIEIYSSAGNGSSLTHTTVRHGGGDGYGAFWVEDGAALALDNVTFEQNEGCDIDELGSIDANNTEFVPCGG